MEEKGAKEMKRKQHERRSNEITVCDDVTEGMEGDLRGVISMSWLEIKSIVLIFAF